MKRIQFLDGLRGIAIILVVCFHAFSRWFLIVPYGDTYASFPIFKYGFLGVQLFFLISGFVILMTLEKCQNFYIFLYKRWKRLFPAMLIATILIYFTATFLPERPAGIPTKSSVIPGLFFIDPLIILKVTGWNINPLEGAFWSLYVEVKFYIAFGFCYFLLGKEKSIIAIFIMFLMSIIGPALHIHFIAVLSKILSFSHFGWFAAGSLAYLYFVNKKCKYLYFSIFVSLLEIYQYHDDYGKLFFSVLILLIFYLPIYFEKVKFIIGNSIFLFFGFISYPLYLIHENAMIALICKLDKLIDITYILLPLIPILILVLISYIIAKRIEPFLQKSINRMNDYMLSRLNFYKK